jgi:hypothetical protein
MTYPKALMTDKTLLKLMFNLFSAIGFPRLGRRLAIGQIVYPVSQYSRNRPQYPDYFLADLVHGSMSCRL